MKVEMSEMEVLMVGTLLQVHVQYPERVALAQRLLDQLGPYRPSSVGYTPAPRERAHLEVVPSGE